MSLSVYIHHVTGRVFKLLAIKERELCGQDAYFADYIDSLMVDMLGALETFPALGENNDYIVVTNIINYLKTNDVPYKALKREVFKSLRLLNRIEAQAGGGCK